MSQQQSASLPDLQIEHEPSSAFLTQCYRNALDRLNTAYNERRPLAIVIAEGQKAPSFVLRSFLAGLGDEVTFARLTQSCRNATDLMRRVIRSAGFQPKDMNLTDLESIFKMFLTFQKSHSRRTIICIEEVQDSEWWVLDKIRSLVEMELAEQYGLMVVVVGRDGLTELLNARPLSRIAAHAGHRIALSPFSQSETREFISDRLSTCGGGEIEQTFDFHAVTLIHELCSGVPDAVYALVNQCMGMLDEVGEDIVGTEIVKLAYEALREAIPGEAVDDMASTVNISEIKSQHCHLLVRFTEDEVREQRLRRGHTLIGRSKICDVRIDSTVISRQHALISYHDGGATLVDLGSTNGTFVDGERIQEHELQPGETIIVGECLIEYVMDEDIKEKVENANHSNSLDSHPVH